MPRVDPLRLFFVCMVVAGTLAASIARANICDEAAHRAARSTGVPADVLLAITRMETGRSRAENEPWPWTVNHAGDGTWFPSEDDARSYVFSKLKRGSTNIDIGCFQINYRWHADAFRSLDDMFDPDSNASYAASFLAQLHAEFGNWTDAAGAYHSRTPEFASKYKAKFATFNALVQDLGLTTSAAIQPAVLREGSAAGLGSLFLTRADDVAPLIDFGGSK